MLRAAFPSSALSSRRSVIMASRLISRLKCPHDVLVDGTVPTTLRMAVAQHRAGPRSSRVRRRGLFCIGRCAHWAQNGRRPGDRWLPRPKGRVVTPPRLDLGHFSISS